MAFNDIGIGLFLGFIGGLFTAFWLLREQRVAAREAGILRERLASAETRLAEEQRTAKEKLQFVEQIETRTAQCFRTLSLEALQHNNRAFAELSQNAFTGFGQVTKNDFERRQEALQHLVSPLQNSLGLLDKKLQEIEKQREGSYSGLTEQLKGLLQAQQRLETETATLTHALREPNVRGHWGEMQLRRVVELAGMLSHVDFDEQVSIADEDKLQRPDMVVHMPNGRDVVIDAKAPCFQHYLKALETQDPKEREAHLQEHARQVRTHVIKLGTKEYYKRLECAPEFVVLFLPSESLFSAAVKTDPSLIDFSAQSNVILATPTTLIALLKAVAHGWRQEGIAAEAREISKLGAELYDRIRCFIDHFSKIRDGLVKANEAYNKALSSLEVRLLTTANRLKEKHIAYSREIESPLAIENSLTLQPPSRDILPIDHN